VELLQGLYWYADLLELGGKINIKVNLEFFLFFLSALESHGHRSERRHVCSHVDTGSHQQRGPRHQLNTHRAVQQVSARRAEIGGLKQKRD